MYYKSVVAIPRHSPLGPVTKATPDQGTWVVPLAQAGGAAENKYSTLSNELTGKP